jgi:hypothetical protein
MTSKFEFRTAVLLAAMSLAACGGPTDDVEPDDGESTATKSDDASSLPQVDLRAVSSLQLGDGLPVSISAVGEYYAIADDDCADGCLHLVRRTADETLELVDSLIPSAGTAAVTASAIPAYHAIALATESGVSIVDVADGALAERETIPLASEPADIFAGAAALLVARGGQGLDLIRLNMDVPEPATMLVEGITKEHTWVTGGEEKTGFFRPIEIELGRDNQLITRSNDGTLFRTNIPTPDLIVHDAAIPETVVNDVLVDSELGATFVASGELGITEVDEFALTTGKESRVQGVDVRRLVSIPGRLATYVGLGAETIGIVQIDTESDGIGEIERSVMWRSLGPLSGATDALYLAEERAFLITSPRGLDWLALP